MRENEKVLREKIKEFGQKLGFEVEEEWTPEGLREEDRREVYIPKIDVVWYKRADPRFVNFLIIVNEKMKKKVNLNEKENLEILPKYKDINKDIVIGFELELSDRPSKYILGDIANLSRMCDYGFIVIRDVENLVKRSIKASRAFSILHGASNVFVISPEELEEIMDTLGEYDENEKTD
ncbi:hypothetical protein [Pyrococcus horikoshii]|uniref:Uncharacterized protein n=2 Tax=Pyrococcus horikoshii TaxID=53953 RepID=O59560_PYRHO|nr:hypothetical protein [Pyrococcus horikoshii]BAA30982.1 178aa long hypothetical protein [Pyrococcus horikoshii OT3]HII61766.1 hypothetical protein [Pyrococcus horikoshii]